jgi:hypothetical protein
MASIPAPSNQPDAGRLTGPGGRMGSGGSGGSKGGGGSPGAVGVAAMASSGRFSKESKFQFGSGPTLASYGLDPSVVELLPEGLAEATASPEAEVDDLP